MGPPLPRSSTLSIMLLLSCSGLTRGFDEGPLFRDLGFELQSGDRVGLVGPNGVGKTTLLRIPAGRLWPTGRDLQRWAAEPAYARQAPARRSGCPAARRAEQPPRHGCHPLA